MLLPPGASQRLSLASERFSAFFKTHNSPFRRRRGAGRSTRRARRRPEAAAKEAQKKKEEETMAMPATTHVPAPTPVPPGPSWLLPTSRGPSHRRSPSTRMQRAPLLPSQARRQGKPRGKRGIAARRLQSWSSSPSPSSPRPAARRRPLRGRTSSWRRSPRTRPPPRAEERPERRQRARRQQQRRQAGGERWRNGLRSHRPP